MFYPVIIQHCAADNIPIYCATDMMLLKSFTISFKIVYDNGNASFCVHRKKHFDYVIKSHVCPNYDGEIIIKTRLVVVAEVQSFLLKVLRGGEIFQVFHV